MLRRQLNRGHGDPQTGQSVLTADYILLEDVITDGGYHMALAEDVYRETKKMPAGKQVEIFDFVQFLKLKEIKNKKQSTQRVKTAKPTPRFGSAKGLIRMSADFDAPLDDFKDYMR